MGFSREIIEFYGVGTKPGRGHGVGHGVGHVVGHGPPVVNKVKIKIKNKN